MTTKALKTALTQKQQDLSALENDLPKIEGLLQQHTDAVETARRSGASYEEQAELRSKAHGFQSVLEQHKADIGVLKAEVNDLRVRYERKSTEDRLAASRAEYQKLTVQHRDAACELLTLMPERLRPINEIEAAARQVKREIETLGLELGVFKRNDHTGTVNTGIHELNFSRPFHLFDESFPEVRSDRAVLGSLDSIRNQDAVLGTGLSRQALRANQAEQEASAARAREATQAIGQAKLRERENRRRISAGQLPLPKPR